MLFSIRGIFNAVGQWFLPLSFIGRFAKLCHLTAGVSAAQPDNGACAGYQASTQLHPVVIEARSASMTTGRSPGR
jgi:hypothetical protein